MRGRTGAAGMVHRGALVVAVAGAAAVAVACSGPGGGLVVACPAIGYVGRLEVRLDDAWPDRDAHDVRVTCLPGERGCELVRDGTLVVAPEPAEPQVLDTPTAPGSTPEQPSSTPDAPAPAPERPAVTGPEWTGTSLTAPEQVAVRVVESESGATVLATSVDVPWDVDDHPYGRDCGGPWSASVEIPPPPG